MKKFKENQGITLIALVITIIVMLILVAVTINITLNGGLFQYASSASQETKYYKDDEKIQALYATSKIGYYLDSNERFSDEVKKEFGAETKVEKSEDGGYTITLPKGDEHIVVSGIDNKVIEETPIGNSTIKVFGYDISLTGETAVDIYFDIPEEKFEKDEEIIKITNPLRETSSEPIVGNKEITKAIKKENFKLKNIGGKKYYGLKYNLMPKEMSDEISVCVLNNTTQDSDVYNFTMKEIGREAVEKSNNSKVAYYIKALLNYGAYCQLAFNHNESSLSNVGYEIEESYIRRIIEEEKILEIDEENSYNDQYIRKIYNSLMAHDIASIYTSTKRIDNNEIFTATCNGVSKNINIDPDDESRMIITERITFEDYNKRIEVKIYNSNKEEVGRTTYCCMDNIKYLMGDEHRGDENRLAMAMLLITQKAYMDMMY